MIQSLWDRIKFGWFENNLRSFCGQGQDQSRWKTHSFHVSSMGNVRLSILLVIYKMQPPKQDLIIKLGALSPQVRVRQVFRPWLRWHKLQSSSDHSWKGKNGRRGHLLLHCCWTFEARTWRKPLPLSRRVHPGLPQRSETLKNRRVQPWIHLFIPYDTARTWRGSLSQVRFPL